MTSRPIQPTAPPGGVGLPDPIDIALRALRSAQVELYCDHESAALTAVRAARTALAGSMAGGLQVRFLVEAAVWHVRHHEFALAQHALADARLRLA
ncbi:MAG TPA: hypothetical protein VFE82_11195 [Ramlibacter sp.]|jgi:hypothetical protein|uniref:hypothetical protein n=1 Tax=Ramlibacter sp. TaxID=1917967 RepID=UPI002D331AB9|nr:hypothetical protein [Ramlibacter sp.]HZY19039.1 hypothetical protein [Ramlibacter sp.]